MYFHGRVPLAKKEGKWGSGEEGGNPVFDVKRFNFEKVKTTGLTFSFMRETFPQDLAPVSNMLLLSSKGPPVAYIKGSVLSEYICYAIQHIFGNS